MLFVAFFIRKGENARVWIAYEQTNSKKTRQTVRIESWRQRCQVSINFREESGKILRWRKSVHRVSYFDSRNRNVDFIISIINK